MLAVSLLTFLFTYNLSAQHHSHTDIHKLDKQIRSTLDSATQHIMLFILKQDTALYNAAIQKAEKAKALTIEYKTLTEKEKGLTGKTDHEETAYFIEEINMFYKPKLKDTVLGDTKKTEKYKYKGQNYLVGSKSKVLLDAFAKE